MSRNVMTIEVEHCLVVDQLRGSRLHNGTSLLHRDPVQCGGLKRTRLKMLWAEWRPHHLNQTEDVASTSCSSRSAAKKAASAWKELQKKKPRGRCFANLKPVSGTSAEFEVNHRGSIPDISADATKELESLADYMPNLFDADARVQALRLYYIELADGMSPRIK
eukprot:Em0020g1107a